MRWEYFEYAERHDQSTGTALNELGLDGWELVSAYSTVIDERSNTYYVFKRPMVLDENPQETKAP